MNSFDDARPSPGKDQQVTRHVPHEVDSGMVWKSRHERPSVAAGESLISSLGAAFRRRWWQVLAVAAPVIALAAVLSYFAPRMYESESTFLLEATGQQGSGAGLELLDRIGRVSRLENEMALLQSRRVVAPTADRLNLSATLVVDGKESRPERQLEAFDVTPEAEEGLFGFAPMGDSARITNAVTGWEIARVAAGDTVRLPGLTFVAPAGRTAGFEIRVDEFASAEDGLQDAIEVTRLGREADLVRLTCTARDAQLAHDMCIELSTSYLELRNELQVSEAANARVFLADATKRIRAQLTEAEDSLTRYATRNSAVALGTKAQEEVRNVAGLAAQRDAKQAELSALREFLATVEGGGAGTGRYRELASFPTFLENDAITEMVASLIQLDNRRSDLSVLRTDENPDLAAVNTRIGAIEQQLQTTIKGYERALAAQIQSLAGTLQNANQRVAGIPSTQIELVRRERTVEQLEALSGTLEGRLREAELAEGVGMPSVRPIDPPEVPRQPSSPSVGLNLALGTTLGLALGFLFAAVREITDVRLRNREQIETAAGMRVLGMIPSVANAGPLLGEVGAAGRLSGSAGGTKGAAARRDREWGPAIESFRTLVADLKVSLANQNGSSPKSIAVMSSAQGEGKTYSTSNLALVWASMGVKTLLVDADLRLGRVADFFGLPKSEPGFSEVLRGSVHPSRAYQEVPAGGGHVLHVLTAGQATSEDTDAFHVPGRISDALEYFEREFDLVLIDTPPLNVVSDSTILAASVGAVLFVVRSGWTRPDALELALQRLQRTNRNLLGIVMNDVALPSYYASYYGSKSGA